MLLKFMNLNIWYDSPLLEKAVEFINTENPDILALQEVCDGHDESLQKGFRSLSILRNSLRLPHFYYSPSFFEMHNGNKVEFGNAIFSRFPFAGKHTTFFDIPYRERSASETDFSLTPRNMQHAAIRINGKTLNIFNVHGIWGKDGNDNERRMKMCRAIAGMIAGRENVILSGDFNVDSSTKSIKQIEEKAANVFKGRIKTSFNMKRKTSPSFASAVVDIIFAGREIKIIDSYCPDVDISDHLPLIIKFDAEANHP